MYIIITHTITISPVLFIVYACASGPFCIWARPPIQNWANCPHPQTTKRVCLPGEPREELPSPNFTPKKLPSRKLTHHARPSVSPDLCVKTHKSGGDRPEWWRWWVRRARAFSLARRGQRPAGPRRARRGEAAAWRGLWRVPPGRVVQKKSLKKIKVSQEKGRVAGAKLVTR